MDLLTFLPVVISLIFTLISFYVILYTARKYKIIEYYLYGLSILTSCALTLVYFIFFFVQGSEFNQLRTIIGIIGSSISGISIFILFFIQNSLSGRNIRIRHYIFLFLFGFGLSMFIFSLNWKWDDQWVVSYEPWYGIVAGGVPVIIIMLELIKLNIDNLREFKFGTNQQRLAYKLMILVWVINLLSNFVLVLERSYISGSSLIWTAVYSLSYIILAISLIEYPFVLFTKNIGLQHLIVSDKISGLPIIELSFIEKSSRHIELFSSAMTGMLSLMKEITQQKDIPKSFSYLNLKIILITLDEIIVYLFVKNEVKSLTAITKNIFKDLKNDHSNLDTIEKRLLIDLAFAQ